MTKNILYTLLVILIFLAGFFTSSWISNFKNKQTNEEKEIFIDQIKQVSKLVTVEGYFSEMYSYKDYYYNLDWWPFRKKALIRVKAKVSMGVDLTKMKITTEEQSRTITLSQIPPPSIISIDHDIDYYDLQEGTFNSFTTEDYNKLNANVKGYIEKIALQSGLPQQAVLQKNIVIENFKFLAQSSDWHLVIDSTNNKQLF